MADLTGLWGTTVSPFRADGTLDVEAAAEHASFLARNGVERLVPGGNTGEFFSLSIEEVIALVRATRAAAADAVVVAGVGGALPTALALTGEAIAGGADGVMVHHPIQTHVGRRGLEEYLRRIGEEADGRVLVYKRTHVVPDDLLTALLRERAIWGVKYAINDLVAFERARESAPEGVWICGTAELWAPLFHLLGADGFTSGLVNAAPRLAVAMEAALREEDVGRALELRELARAFEELRAEDGAAKNVPAVRLAMELAGFPSGPPRPPLSPLEPADADRVRAIWSTWKEAGLAQEAPERVAGLVRTGSGGRAGGRGGRS